MGAESAFAAIQSDEMTRWHRGEGRGEELGVQGYPTFICAIHVEEQGSQGVWKGSSAKALGRHMTSCFRLQWTVDAAWVTGSV